MAALSLLSLFVATAGQGPVPTQPSWVLAHGANVYVASPTYAVKPACADERFLWSPDGTRLAYVSNSPTDSPRAVERRLARGESANGTFRLGVWSRDTGRTRDIQLGNGQTGVGRFVFMGRDLVFDTSTETAEGTRRQLWLARDGGTPMPIDVPGIESAVNFLSARRRQALLAVGASRMWLLDANRTLEIKVPGYKGFLGRGVTPNDQAVVMAIGAGDQQSWLLVNLSDGTYRAVDKQPSTTVTPEARPFIADAYALGGKKSTLFDNDADAGKIDDRKIRIGNEDGGYQVDLVERTGSPRRRIPFIHEASADVQVSDDGLAFAFVSNRTLMVRYLVKLDPAVAKRYQSGG